MCELPPEHTPPLRLHGTPSKKEDLNLLGLIGHRTNCLTPEIFKPSIFNYKNLDNISTVAMFFINIMDRPIWFNFV